MPPLPAKPLRPLREKLLLGRIGRFCSETGLSPTRFGISACRDPRLVRDLKEGRELRTGTRQQVEAFMAGYAAKKSIKAS